MPKNRRVPAKLRPLLRPAGLMMLTFALSAARLAGNYAPFALAAVALSGPKLPGLCSLLGAAAGAFVFFDFQPGLRFLASAILIFSASTAFYDSPIYTRPAFRPAAAATMTALVQAIYLIERPLRLSVVFALSLALQWAAYTLLAPLWKKSSPGRRQAGAALLFALCIALFPLESYGFSLGRSLMTAALLLFASACPSPSAAAAMGLAAGLSADLALPAAPLYAVAFAAGCAAAWGLRAHRWLCAPLFALVCAALALLFEAQNPAAVCYETFFGAAVFLLLPRRLLPATSRKPKPAALPPSPLQEQLALSAAAFRDLYSSFFLDTPTTPPENPSVIFDQAAEQVCRKCVLCSTCWHQNYNETYNAFNDACGALLRRGQALAQDFPIHFTSRCVHLQPFLAALNSELRTFLLRQQYHRRLWEARRQAQAQYAQLGELLSSTAAVEAMAAAPLGYRIASRLQPRTGSRICGDQSAVFEVGGVLYLLLCDGMGSGESAHREAAMTVRLLRQFLQAGIQPVPALKTLNAAWQLRSETSGGFTTIDLLALQRQSGSAVLYKYGAAPSYCKRSGSVTRFSVAALPAGLQDGAAEPESSSFSLAGGSFFVMVSDGIADQHNDEWLQNLLAGWSGNDAEQLCSLILAERSQRCEVVDDCAVLVLHLSPPGEGQKQQI